MSRRGKLDQRQEEGVAGLGRFALLLLAGQPCQPQLVMDPDRRERRLTSHVKALGHWVGCMPNR